MITDEQRQLEFGKYERAYQGPYGMSLTRMRETIVLLEQLPVRGSYLDVGCGKGEMIRQAVRLGFAPVQGVEIVDNLIDNDRVIYGEAHKLPFHADFFNVVVAFDVIEHLLPGDDEAACREMARVASNHVMFTVNNKASYNYKKEILHINRRPYDEWHELFKKWFQGNLTWLTDYSMVNMSETWRVDL